MKIKKKSNDIRNIPYPVRCNRYQSSVRIQDTQIQTHEVVAECLEPFEYASVGGEETYLIH